MRIQFRASDYPNAELNSGGSAEKQCKSWQRDCEKITWGILKQHLD